MIKFKAIGSTAPSTKIRFPNGFLVRREFAPMPWIGHGFGFCNSSNHFVPMVKPHVFKGSTNGGAMFRSGFPAFRWAASSLIAIGNSLSVFFCRNATPSRIVGAGKKLTLAFGFAASVSYASFNETAFPVELGAANNTFERSAILAIGSWPRSWPHVASIEKPGEFGGTLNGINDTLSQTLSQYRTKPIEKSSEGVTTSARSLTSENCMAVKRHEPPARKGRYSLSYGVTHRSADKEPHDNISDSDWDLLNISASETLSYAEYQWRQIAVNIVASGREQRINNGESRIFSLAKYKLKNAIRTFNNSFSSDLYSDGTATNQINGLQAIVADAAGGTVGGINSTTYTWWDRTLFDCSVNSVTSSATTIENSMLLPLWLNLDRGPDDSPDLIVMDNTYYRYFEASQVSIKRYMDSSNADGGLVSLKYKGADVYFDGNSGIPSSHAYMLNSNYLELVVHKDADLDTVESQRPINQDGSVIPILWMGNLTCSNRKQQGVIIE